MPRLLIAFLIASAAGVYAIGAGWVSADGKVQIFSLGDSFDVNFSEKLTGGGETEVEMVKAEPEIRVRKWSGEINMGISYGNVSAVAEKALLSDTVVWKGAKEEVHAYPINDTDFEIEILLSEKPATNVFNFAIDGAENLDFFYQAPLNEVFSNPLCTATQCDDWHRPENVVGSYAVYHKEKKNHIAGQTNYGTGKAFHIFRPKAIDGLGREEWGELSYKDGVLSVTIPQTFLDTAVYPVKVDPTFGFTSQGASSGNSASAPDELFVNVHQSPADFGTATQMSIFLSGGAGLSTRAAIYSDSSGPSALLAQSGNQSTVTDPSWINYTISYTGSPNTNYWLASSLDTGNVDIYWDSGTSQQLRVRGVADFATLPDPYGTPDQTFDFKQSIYVTYTATGGTHVKIRGGGAAASSNVKIRGGAGDGSVKFR